MISGKKIRSPIIFNIVNESTGNGTGIHHPGGLVKKLAATYSEIQSYPGELEGDDGYVSPPHTFWVFLFDKGLTASGSSGSPLFDENLRIAGQLLGHAGEYMLYGKVSRSWKDGNTSFEKLKPFLDPRNTGTLVHDGYYPPENPVDAHGYTDFQNVCPGEPVYLKNGSLFSPDSYTWDFIPSTVSFTSGTNASSENPVVIFNDNVAYTLVLTASNTQSSNTQTRENYLHADQEILPIIITPLDTTFCISANISFYAFGKGSESYSWNILGESDYLIVDSLSLQQDTIRFSVNDTAAFDSSFVVTLQLIGSHGICSDTAYQEILIEFQANDLIENALLLEIGGNGPFNNYCASVEEDEPNPEGGNCNNQSNWCDCNVSNILIDNSMWYKFVGPASGIIGIDAPGFDNQIAIYEADSYSDILSGNPNLYSILAANDDYFDEDKDFSALIEGASVVPGKTYWLQVDGSACGTFGTFYINLYNRVINPVETLTETTKLVIYPNPASEYFIIKNEIALNNPMVYINSIDGKMIYHKKAISSQEEILITLPESVANGIYIIQVIDKNTLYQATLSIQR